MNGKWSYIDDSGKTIISVPNEVQAYPFSDGLALIIESSTGPDGKNYYSNIKYIDHTGKAVINIINDYDDFYKVINARSFSNGLAALSNVNDGNKFIDKSGQVAFLRGSTSDFSCGYAFARFGGKSDIINKAGELVFSDFHANQYLTNYGFSENLSWVFDKDGKRCVINTNGEIVVSAKQAERYSGGMKFSSGFSIVWGEIRVRDRRGNNPQVKGIIDKHGYEVISLDNKEYFDISDVKDGYAIALGTDWNYYVLEIKSTTQSLTTLAPLPENPTPTPEKPQTVTAKPTTTTIFVNGVDTKFEAYIINDSNYIKLRDIAYVLNGTSKQFEVGWDGANNAINLTKSKPYTIVSGEMQGVATANKKATPTTSKIYLDGKEIALTAYNIGGNNYFKLRDVGESLGFYVDWEPLTSVALISTNDYNNLTPQGVIEYNKALAIEGISNAITAYGDFYDGYDNISGKYYNLVYLRDRGYYDIVYMNDGKIVSPADYGKPSAFQSKTNTIFAVKDIWVDGKEKKLINISIAGTQILFEWINKNFDFTANGNGLHSGFADNAKLLENVENKVKFSKLDLSLAQIIADAANGSDKYLIFVNGHSMGGAVANIYTYWLSQRQVPNTSLISYTFASPLPTSKFDDSNTPIYNILNDDDNIIWLGVNISGGFRFGVDRIFRPTQEFRNEYYGGYSIQEKIANVNVFDIIRDAGFDFAGSKNGAYYTARHEQKMYLLITMRYIE